MNTQMQEIIQIRQQAECIATTEQVEEAIIRLADTVSVALADTNPVCYIIMHGGIFFAGNLLPRLQFPLQVAYLHVSRYHYQLSADKLRWHTPPTLSPRQRTVIIFDDILDQGHTLLQIKEYMKQQGAAAVYTAVLADKQHQRKAVPGFRADFTALEVPDYYLFGCGMDYKGYWRNNSAIYAVKNSS